MMTVNILFCHSMHVTRCFNTILFIFNNDSYLCQVPVIYPGIVLEIMHMLPLILIKI